MRLYEFENRFADDLATVLRNLIGRSNTKHQSIKLSYPALSNLMTNMGYGSISFDLFDKVLQTSPELQNLVKDHNDQMVELSTETDAPDNSKPVPVDRGSKTVDQMASRAAQAELK